MLHDLKIIGPVATFYDSRGRGPIIVDTADLWIAYTCSWRVCQGHTTTYARGSVGPKKARQGVALHRLVLGATPGQLVDHIDHNGLNNTRSNLRIVSPTQNGQNRKKGRGAYTSRFKGVRKKKGAVRHQTWLASIRVNKKKLYLGVYLTEEDAARAYNQAALKHFGPYAYLNAV